MPNQQIKLLTSIRWSIAYLVAVPVIVCAIIVWISYQRVHDFEVSQQKIAESTVLLISKEVSKVIDNKQRLVSIFTQNEHTQIEKLAKFPDDDELKAKISQKLGVYFPNYFTFTLADHDGNPIIDDFDGYIGQRCLRDIKRIATGQEQKIHIHPNPYEYHIDIMTQWGNDKDGGIFFISFRTDFLSKLLKISSPYRHELKLINTEVENLIEITEEGARIVLKRDDARLTEEELARILYAAPVSKANWKLADFREANLFSDYRNKITIFSAIIIFLFFTGSALMIVSLLRAEKRRLAAERVKEDMFSLFNHDLRAPLNSIYGALQLLSNSPTCDDRDFSKELAGAAFNNAKVMLGLINDILDIQKMERGGMEFDLVSVELTALAKETVEMNSQYGNMLNVNFELVKPENKIFVKADKRRLQQALTNLISNAIKYSPENETVTISITPRGRYTRVTVTDKGPGIPKDFQPQVFDKFSQSKSELTRSVGGTGLGLAIVKYIIDNHDGYVHFETESGTGTRFHIDLWTYHA